MRFLKGIVLKIINIYQSYSKYRPSSCRYYPTCSEYSKWCFENSNIFTAFYKSIFRILSCNQLFEGGISYPVIKKDFKNSRYINRVVKIKYFYIEKEQGKFYVIKSY